MERCATLLSPTQHWNTNLGQQSLTHEGLEQTSSAVLLCRDRSPFIQGGILIPFVRYACAALKANSAAQHGLVTSSECQFVGFEQFNSSVQISIAHISASDNGADWQSVDKLLQLVSLLLVSCQRLDHLKWLLSSLFSEKTPTYAVLSSSLLFSAEI